ncbi:hypothetical protein [Streptomyces europaeiscabiei]|uniref:hypothetical protein n=1 Tax=Streptomyces europaeiscabiei TaxID=146819 RepID=UPI0015C4F65C
MRRPGTDPPPLGRHDQTGRGVTGTRPAPDIPLAHELVDEPTGGLPWEALRAYGGPGPTVPLGPLSEPARALAVGREDVAMKLLAPWKEIFGREC